MTEAVPQRGRLARKDRAEKIALHRYQLIRAAADQTLSTRQRGPMVRALAAAEHVGPDGHPVRYSRETWTGVSISLCTGSLMKGRDGDCD